MKKKFKTFAVITLIGLFFFTISAMATNREVPVEIYRFANEYGGGGAVEWVSYRVGFPLNFMSNNDRDALYEISWVKILFDIVFWFGFAWVFQVLFKRIKK